MTAKEEAKRLYKKYEGEYIQARAAQKKAENEIDSYKSQKKMKESSLESSKSEKKNLEARLADMKEIIFLLENNVPSQISNANHAAKMAGEKYVLAIKCSEITNASIQDAYRTKSVEEDVNSANTYQCSLDEKVRLENAIESLRIQIQRIDSEIASLDAGICAAVKTCDACQYTVQSLQKKINYYRGYM